MRVTAWNNGGSTYGIRIGAENRRQFFESEWETIEIEIDGAVHSLPLTAGFWKDCPEIRGRVLRDWLERHDALDWEGGKPPAFELVPVGGRRFRLVS